MDALLSSLLNFWESTGVYKLINSVEAQWWQTIVMLGIVCVLAYLAIVKGFEPLLLLPIAIGMLLTNLPGGGLFHSNYWFCDTTEIANLMKEAHEAIGTGDFDNLMNQLREYVAYYDITFVDTVNNVTHEISSYEQMLHWVTYFDAVEPFANTVSGDELYLPVKTDKAYHF